MSPLKRGWCPTLDRPMASGDGLLVRVQPCRATLTPEEARALARAALCCGNGIMELTQRGNIQLRGLRPETVALFAAAMEEAGIPSPGPLLPPPLLGVDPGIDPRTEAVVAALEHGFATDTRLAGLPGKFAVAVDGGGLLGGRPVAADLMAHADGRVLAASGGDAGVLAGPLPGGVPRLSRVGLTQAGPMYASPGGPTHTSPPGLTQGSRAGGDSGAEARPAESPLEGDPRVEPGGDVRCGLGDYPPGIDEEPAPPPYALAPPLAQFDAAMLHDLADLADRHATTIRMTPWRALVLAGFAGSVADARWITDPADPRLLVTACIGAAGCSRGTTPTRADAARLRPRTRVHVSGCIKGCAHPGPAPLTLVARDGRYDLVHHGRAADLPAKTGLTLEDILSHA